MEIALNKYLSQMGVASRRKSEKLILEGKVLVNGNIVTVPYTKVNSEKDQVSVSGKEIKNEEKVYILLNKPKGVASTPDSEYKRQTVLDLVKVPERIVPVGRLDRSAEGLIILTNDGDLVYKLTNPKFSIEKTYFIRVAGDLTDQKLEKLKRGVNDRYGKTLPAQVEVKSKGKHSLLEITLFEGKNRQIKNICSDIGLEVIDLKRISIGQINIYSLAVGKWRYLTSEEIQQLKS